MKNLKRTIINLIFFIVLIILTFFIILKDQDLGEIYNILINVKLQYVILGILVMVIYFGAEAFNVRRILKTFNENIGMIKALKYTLIGFFFSAITPAATGGQPMEIYYMYKEKFSGSYSITALLIQLSCFQIVTISMGIICAIINWKMITKELLFLFIIGITINGIAATLMFISLFSKRLTKKLINATIKILEFFKYKKIESKKEELEKGLEKYNYSSEFIKTHKVIYLKSLLVVFIQMIAYYSVPFFVYKAFGLNEYNLFQIITIQALLYCSVSGIPLPGAVGISESVFLKIYSGIFGATVLSSAMLLNRGINFYLFVVISAIIVIVNAIKNRE